MNCAERNLAWLAGIVDTQTNDNRLWAAATAGSSWLLQEALVTLHEAIEAVQGQEEPDA